MQAELAFLEIPVREAGVQQSIHPARNGDAMRRLQAGQPRFEPPRVVQHLSAGNIQSLREGRIDRFNPRTDFRKGFIQTTPQFFGVVDGPGESRVFNGLFNQRLPPLETVPDIDAEPVHP